MLFMITVQDYYKHAQISSVRVRYITSGRQYNFVINPYLCKPDLQNVEWMLVCHGETGNLWLCSKECIHITFCSVTIFISCMNNKGKHCIVYFYIFSIIKLINRLEIISKVHYITVNVQHVPYTAHWTTCYFKINPPAYKKAQNN